MPMTVLSASDVTRVLSPELAIETQEQAYRSVVNGTGRLAASWAARDPDHGALVFVLTGAIDGVTGTAFKFGVEQSANAPRGLPVINAAVVLTDRATGVPLACLHGGAISLLRTSAGLAVAARELAPRGARTLGILGSGSQAHAAARMLKTVREFDSIAVWSPTADHRDRLAGALRRELRVDVGALDSAQAVVERSDVVATCTTSRTPVIAGAWLRPGQTILTIGSNEADRAEVDLETTVAAQTFVDDVAECRRRCGPVLAALEAGALQIADLTPLGDVLEGRRPGRVDDEAIVLFHSVGVGVQDAAAAWAAYERAKAVGCGQTVEF